jgi:hypothetical protein
VVFVEDLIRPVLLPSSGPVSVIIDTAASSHNDDDDDSTTYVASPQCCLQAWTRRRRGRHAGTKKPKKASLLHDRGQILHSDWPPQFPGLDGSCRTIFVVVVACCACTAAQHICCITQRLRFTCTCMCVTGWIDICRLRRTISRLSVCPCPNRQVCLV